MCKHLDRASLLRPSNLHGHLGTLPNQFLYWLHVGFFFAESCITLQIYDSRNYRCRLVCFECRTVLNGYVEQDYKRVLCD